ncbi:hypothetical protein [Roseospira goensis]|uniref:Uncharacterized protein n=1 Tax=Roseospira goensis TaxID=391922 RepID=A0A7W6WJG1_9PROT|nr:hypothetical protein [Roseospira goensis]MBB4284533.1 hypothetical protein [Roseospira goensis]
MNDQATALTITPINGEPRILDTDLAVKLGYERPRAIRQIIERYISHLSSLGYLAPHRVAQLRSNGATHFVDAYYLNRKQALFIITQAGRQTRRNDGLGPARHRISPGKHRGNPNVAKRDL